MKVQYKQNKIEIYVLSGKKKKKKNLENIFGI